MVLVQAGQPEIGRLQSDRQTTTRTMSNTNDVTRLLLDWRAGDQGALAELLPRVEHALPQIAARQMRGERPGHTLQATVLVNDAYLKLVDAKVKVVEMNFSGGMTYDEIAEALGISPATVDRELRMAKAWLYRELKDAGARES